MPASSMCSMMPAMRTLLAVTERVDIHLGGILEEAVDEHRTLLRKHVRFLHIAAHHFFVIRDDHGASAQYVTGADQHGVPDARPTSQASSTLVAVPFCGRRNAQVIEQFAEQLPIFREVDISWVRADDGYALTLERQGKVQRRLPAELNDDAVRLLGIADVQDFFQRERLEVEAVTGVVIGRDRFGVAVHHDRLEAEFLERERCVATAIIELDSLPDSIGTAAEDQDLLAVRRIGFARELVASSTCRA